MHREKDQKEISVSHKAQKMKIEMEQRDATENNGKSSIGDLLRGYGSSSDDDDDDNESSDGKKEKEENILSEAKRALSSTDNEVPRDDHHQQTEDGKTNLKKRKRGPICRYFLMGKCKHDADSCKFVHCEEAKLEREHRREENNKKQKGGPPSKKQRKVPTTSTTLLKKLLNNEKRREQCLTLQCLKYFVDNDFFNDLRTTSSATSAPTTKISSISLPNK